MNTISYDNLINENLMIVDYDASAVSNNESIITPEGYFDSNTSFASDSYDNLIDENLMIVDYDASAVSNNESIITSEGYFDSNTSFDSNTYDNFTPLSKTSGGLRKRPSWAFN